MKSHTLRPAVAMIELIFSIVIMGLVLLSAPMLISTATKSTTVALQQEGINEAASRINMILTYPWDENNANSVCADYPSILNVSAAGDSELGRRNPSDTNVRIGIPPNSKSHTFGCGGTGVANELNATSIGMDAGGILDDMDDFNNVGLVEINDSSTGGEDYIENPDTTGGDTVKINTSIKYVSDTTNYDSNPQYNFNPLGNATGITNIKAITVTVTSSSSVKELQKEIKMHAFSCNIGGYRYATRDF